MNNKSPYPKIYSLHSQKGGVGKTSIAVAIAGLEGIIQGKKTLIIDSDLTGANINDVLNPGRKSEKKSLNDLLMADPHSFMRYTRNRRSKKGRPKSQNRLLEDFYEKVDDSSNIEFISGSTLPGEVAKIVPLLAQEDFLHFFRSRFMSIFLAVLNDKFDVIIIDHPPGLYGLSKSNFNLLKEMLDYTAPGNSQADNIPPIMYMLLSKMKQGKNDGGRPGIFPGLIFSGDKTDYRSLFRTLGYLMKSHDQEGSDDVSKSMRFIPNRITVDDPLLFWSDLIKDLKSCQSSVGGFAQSVWDQAKKHGSITCPLVKDFNIEKILSAVIQIKSGQKDILQKSQEDQKKSREDPMVDWCNQLARMFHLDIPKGKEA